MAIEITSQFNNKAGKPLDVNSVKATIAERDAIPIDERYSGIEVFVIQTLKKYILKVGFTNDDWEEISNNIYSYEEEFVDRTFLTVTHNMNKYPSVVVMDSTMRQVVTEVTYIDRNRLDVSWTGETSGRIVCN